MGNEYLNEINEILTNRIDGNLNGKKDGKVTIEEALNDLDIGSLLGGLEEGSTEYNKLKNLTDKIPEALKKYANSDGIFQAEEWADFLNGQEWGEVIDTYHSSSNFVKTEMEWVDSSKGMFNDGQTTKGEVKAGLLNNLAKLNISNKQSIAKELESLVDKYAGNDGSFTVAEYTKMKNDSKYKEIINKYNLVPFNIET